MEAVFPLHSCLMSRFHKKASRRRGKFVRLGTVSGLERGYCTGYCGSDDGTRRGPIYKVLHVLSASEALKA